MTIPLLVGYLVLQFTFIWASFAVFRRDGKKPIGVWVIEVSTLASVTVGTLLICCGAKAYLGLEITAFLMVVASGALFVWALGNIRKRQLTSAFYEDAPNALITKGPFRFIRNPFYLSYLLAHTVPCLASQSTWGLLPLVCMTLVYQRAARFEECKFLASVLAGQYKAYLARTGRFLPRLRKGT